MSIHKSSEHRIRKENVTVRFAGDSGDGMQLSGTLFTNTTALAGNDLATLPDYPAEIRAPAGTLPGVSGYQIHFSSHEIFTPGDEVDALVCMNPAALRVNLADVRLGGHIIANSDKFQGNNLKMAGYNANPLEDGSLDGYQLHKVPIGAMTRTAVEPSGLKTKEADRCKNLLALGIVYWLYDRPLEPTLEWIRAKFAKQPDVMQANELALKAGYHYGETAEMFQAAYHVDRARLEPGTYRKIRGNEAAALGLIAAAHKAGKQLFYGSYPITPASDILHELSRHKNYGVITFQAEDEIAAICAVIGAAYGGAFAATGTSGPGMALKAEGIGLGVMLELPLVVINCQRGGPSTGLPTKPEQTDLLQAVYGRNGECPVPVLSPKSPSDCFNAAYEAFQIAVRHMTPVIVLSDGFLANSSEPWKVPCVDELPVIAVHHDYDPQTFQPYNRDANLARPWSLPGAAGLAHRIGGLEKQDGSGAVNYEAENHQHMVETRQKKVDGIARYYEKLSVLGDASGELLLLSWGGTYGAARMAVERARQEGYSVSHLQLRQLNPLPLDLEGILHNYARVLIPELNLGQLRQLIRAKYLIDAIGLSKVKGKPFMVSEIYGKITAILS